MAFFDAAAQAVVEIVLRFVMNNPVAAGNQKLQGRGNGLRIGDDAFGSFVQTKQDAHGNGAGNQRIVVVAGLAFLVVRQVMGFDVAVDKEIAAPFLHDFQAGAGKRNVEFDFECGRCQYGTADFWRVVVQPSGHQYRADALRDHADVFRLDAVFVLDVADKVVHIGNGSTDTGAVAAFAGAVAMTARVPCEIGKIIKTEFVGNKHHPAGMLVAAVEQHDGFIGRTVGSGSVAVEKRSAVLGRKVFLLLGHEKLLIVIFLNGIMTR